MADTSFLVFRNEQQREYLGARTNVLGVDPNFDLARDYYVNFHDANPKAPETISGIPLLTTGRATRAPGPHEVVVASGVADYVGVQPGAEAIVELVYVPLTNSRSCKASTGFARAAHSTSLAQIRDGSIHSGCSMREVAMS